MKMRREVQLLLLCARTNVDSQTAERIKTLVETQSIDWSYLYEAGIQHLQIPLLHRNLSVVRSVSAPKDFIAKLGADCIRISAWNLFLTDELTKLLRLLNEHEIPAIPFKGPVLAASVYGSLALRVYSDLDVFVQKQNLTKIQEVLLQNQYSTLQQTSTQKEFALKHKYHFQFIEPQKKAIIEVHWKFTRDKLPLAVDEEGLWARARSVPFAGMEVKTFSPEDLFLLLCVHGAKHRWMRLGWLCDISEMVRMQTLDWERIVQMAKQMRVLRILFLGLHLIQDLLDAPVPDGIIGVMKKDSIAVALASNIRDYILNGDPAVLCEEQLFYSKVRESIRDKARTFLYFSRLDASSTKNTKISKWLIPVKFLRKIVRRKRLDRATEKTI